MTTERESLLNKIRALLAKTMQNGCSEAEALTALDKARAMMDAYAVSESERNDAIARIVGALVRGRVDSTIITPVSSILQSNTLPTAAGLRGGGPHCSVDLCN